ncbi:alpha-D-ribose 1-methylphosphonate 5-triphosphate diphosphatase [Pukyongiella litopenaei]|uniref:Alpha-D-ribose 1-methylphosphonate 5-triphosphate diphosphatase n=1 Tax=Pukyongiella litopenaei TaxID=2605946 RepID=A0A2S0MRU7_9RHOB|nr:alpha-D-ribose 1-methylphosphonate 5-triphosphate diphosphatase [Pukyongiella litopenaei]AVO38471.1 alpha-D-ribose 1-methylphosphonate 5-triphosphate diphosphatase [Pukyongiella litopenaei]
MTALRCDLAGARVLLPGQGLVPARLTIADGVIAGAPVGRAVDLAGFLLLPGIVDLHGDGFERHVAPRRGAMTQLEEGVIATGAELAANGITTAVLAQFHSWEGGLRGPEFAARFFAGLAQARAHVVTDLIPQLRLETHLLDDFAALPARLAGWGIDYVVFNDHLPHDRLAAGRRPPRLAGQALKAGRNPERHLEMLQALHARGAEVPAALDALCARLAAQGVRMGSHDDRTAQDRAAWAARGVRIAEFPETAEAAEAARAEGSGIILGAPNLVRGASHKGNVSARDLVAAGLCDALASDYHYPSPRRAALALADSGTLDFAAAWALVSEGPARLLDLSDRGRLAPGLRADLVLLDEADGRVAATIAGGRVAYMQGDVAARFCAGPPPD